MAAAEEEMKEEKEGTNLLGPPTFIDLDNGRFRCLETGHEMLLKDKESYSQSKRCRLGLIDFALLNKKPPLNMFKQDPLSRLKLICKLTEDIINKSEEHIWKHINGKRFLHKLEEKEEEKLRPKETVVEEKQEKVSKSKVDGKKKKKNKDKGVDEIKSEVRDTYDKESDSEEAEFWIPPVGERWDFDDGEDRWGSGSEHESGDDGGVVNGDTASEELSKQTKRMSIEIGPSSFASKKKKRKKNTS